MTKKLTIAGVLGAVIAPVAALADAAKDALGGLQETGTTAGVTTTTTLPELIGTVIKYALSLVGLIFLVLMVYGGYIWMIARGDEGKVDKAKDTITNAIIGIIVVAGAYAITGFIVQAFTKS